MLTEEERNSIIDEVTKAVLLAVKEEILLCLPEVIGNLMVQHISHHELNKKFYAAHEEFKDKKGIVAKIIEEIEGKDPLKNYEDILKEAVPEIENRIKIMSTLDMDSVNNNPDRYLGGLDITDETNNQHGIL